MKIISLVLSVAFVLMPGYSQTIEKILNDGSFIQGTEESDQPESLFSSGNDSRGKIDLRIYYLPGLSLSGAGRNLGSEILVFDKSSWVGESDLPDDVIFDSRMDYGDKITPIITKPKPEIPFSLNIGYTHDGTRISISWDRISASDKQSGKVPGLYEIDEETSQEFGYGYVSFWNMGIDLHESRNYPASWFEGTRDLDENEDGDYTGSFDPEKGSTEWSTSHETSLNSLRLTINHPLIIKERLKLSLSGGLQYGRWRDNLMQLLNMTGHDNLTDIWTENAWDELTGDSIKIELHLKYIFNNEITLKTNSSASFNSIGLLAGIEADWNVLPSLFFNLKASAATLSGEASYTGRVIDVDDIFIEDIFTGYDQAGNMLFTDPLMAYEYLSGNFDLPEYSGSVSSINYRLNIGARYEITSDFFLRAGYSYSLWKNLPMSPHWTYSDQYTIPYNAFALEKSWETSINSDISSSGFYLGIILVF
jgi:hypothetical protein